MSDKMGAEAELGGCGLRTMLRSEQAPVREWRSPFLCYDIISILGQVGKKDHFLVHPFVHMLYSSTTRNTLQHGTDCTPSSDLGRC